MPVKLNSMLNSKYNWWRFGSLFDADFQNNRYGYAGRPYTSEASWLTAINGTKNGNVRIIGPYVFGTELCADPGFSNGVDGWVTAPTYTGVVSHQTNKIRIAKTVGGTAMRAAKPFTVTDARAYRWKLDYLGRSDGNTNSQSMNTSQDSALSGSASAFVPSGGTAPTSNLQAVGSSESSSHYAGIVMAVIEGTAPYTEWDNQSFQEAYPYNGYTVGSLSFAIEGTMPGTASGNKVIAQWGEDRERNRVRLVWDASKNLRLIVTRSNVEQVNLNFGVVEVNTAFKIKAAVTTNRASGSLNGGLLQTDTSVTMPGLGKFWLGQGPSGEVFDGTINRVTVWPTALSDFTLTDPLLSFMVFGDSTASATEWRTNLATAYEPDRTILGSSAGGENTGQLLARVQAATDANKWTTIFMDLPNTGETFDYWIGNIKAAVALLQTNRWYVHPPAQNSQGGMPLNSAAVVTQVQQALLTDPFFAGHTMPATGTYSQANYLAAVNFDSSRVGTAGDFTHFSSAGQAIQATYIKAFMDSQGW